MRDEAAVAAALAALAAQYPLVVDRASLAVYQSLVNAALAVKATPAEITGVEKAAA